MITATTEYQTRMTAGSKTPIYLIDIKPMPNHLIGAWRLNEATDPVEYADWTGNNPLTGVNVPTTAAGKIASTAVQFTAASSHFLRRAVADNDPLIIQGDTDFMVTAWVYLDSKGAARTIVSHWINAGAGEYQSWDLEYNNATDRFEFNIFTSVGGYDAHANVLGSPSTGIWYWIVAWHDATKKTINISVNNGTATSTVVSGLIRGSLGDFYIGAVNITGPANYWDGRIEQVTFWRRLLTSDELSDLYNGSVGKDFQFLFHGYQFSTRTQPSYLSLTPGIFPEIITYGYGLLAPIELRRDTQIESSHLTLSELKLDILDIEIPEVPGAHAASVIVAEGIIGWRCDFYQTYFDIGLDHLTLIFSGLISEIERDDAVYHHTIRSFISAAQEKVLFADTQTQLTVAANAFVTTLTVRDASLFPHARSDPQSFRRFVLIEDEIATYRGISTRNADGTYDLTDVIRSPAGGYAFPPLYGANAAHDINDAVQVLHTLGSMVNETAFTNTAWTNVEVNIWMHPFEFLRQILTVDGPNGLGEFAIPVNTEELEAAMDELGLAAQGRYVTSESVIAKDFIETEFYQAFGAYPTENNDGSVGIKLFPSNPLKAAWKCESTANPAIDEMNVDMEPNYNLMMVASPTQHAGKVGFGLGFNGSTQYLWRPVSGLQCANSTFFMSMWVYLSSKAADMTLASQYDAGANADQSWRCIYKQSTDRFRFSIYNGAGTEEYIEANNFGSPSTGTWYFVVFGYVRFGRTLRISVNAGTQNTSASITAFIPAMTLEEFRIAASGNGAGVTAVWNGVLDEIGFFHNYELTATDIETLYNSGNGMAIETFTLDTHDPADSITDASLVERPKWLRNAEKITNRVVYHFDYMPPTDKFASTFECRDNAAIAAAGREITLEIFSKIIRSRYSTAINATWFDMTARMLHDRAKAILERFGTRAPRISAVTNMHKHLLEVADDCTATFDQVLNLDNGEREIEDAPFEIASMVQDYRSNVIEFELLGYPS